MQTNVELGARLTGYLFFFLLFFKCHLLFLSGVFGIGACGFTFVSFFPVPTDVVILHDKFHAVTRINVVSLFQSSERSNLIRRKLVILVYFT